MCRISAIGWGPGISLLTWSLVQHRPFCQHLHVPSTAHLHCTNVEGSSIHLVCWINGQQSISHVSMGRACFTGKWSKPYPTTCRWPNDSPIWVKVFPFWIWFPVLAVMFHSIFCLASAEPCSTNNKLLINSDHLAYGKTIGILFWWSQHAAPSDVMFLPEFYQKLPLVLHDSPRILLLHQSAQRRSSEAPTGQDTAFNEATHRLSALGSSKPTSWRDQWVFWGIILMLSLSL